jgi:hypothetical protein
MHNSKQPAHFAASTPGRVTARVEMPQALTSLSGANACSTGRTADKRQAYTPLSG